MTTFSKLLFPLLMSAALLAGCSEKEASVEPAAVPKNGVIVTVSTARGPVEFTKRPEKLAVLDVGTLDILNELGVPVAGVPDNVYLPYLKEKAASAEPVGTLFEPDLEKIYHMKPDLVVLSMRSSPKYDEVAAVAPVIDMSNNGEDQIAEGLERLEAFGKLTGTQEKASEIAEELRALVDETRALSAGAGSGLVVMVSGGKLSAFSAHSRFGWIYKYLGFRQVTDDMKRAPHGQPVSFEFITQTDPDWLFIIDRGAAIGEEGASARHVLDNDLMHGTKAWRNKRIVYLSLGTYIAPGGIHQIRDDLILIRDALKEASR